MEDGECYLFYASDSLSLFVEGIQMIVRSEYRPWTEIYKLSGGQQATCGVSVGLNLFIFQLLLFTYEKMLLYSCLLHLKMYYHYQVL